MYEFDYQLSPGPYILVVDGSGAHRSSNIPFSLTKQDDGPWTVVKKGKASQLGLQFLTLDRFQICLQAKLSSNLVRITIRSDSDVYLLDGHFRRIAPIGSEEIESANDETILKTEVGNDFNSDSSADDAVVQVIADFAPGFSEEEIANCLAYVSEIYREQGGAGLKVIESQSFSFDSAEVPNGR